MVKGALFLHKLISYLIGYLEPCLRERLTTSVSVIAVSATTESRRLALLPVLTQLLLFMAVHFIAGTASSNFGEVLAWGFLWFIACYPLTRTTE